MTSEMNRCDDQELTRQREVSPTTRHSSCNRILLPGNDHLSSAVRDLQLNPRGLVDDDFSDDWRDARPRPPGVLFREQPPHHQRSISRRSVHLDVSLLQITSAPKWPSWISSSARCAFRPGLRDFHSGRRRADQRLLSFSPFVSASRERERERERAKDCSSKFRVGYLVHRFAVSGASGDCSGDSHHSFVSMLIAQFESLGEILEFDIPLKS